MDKNQIIGLIGYYIEALPDGYNTTIARIVLELFPGGWQGRDIHTVAMDGMTMFDIWYQSEEWIRKRGNVYLDELHHYRKLEGLPFNLDFYVRHRDAQGNFVTKLPESFVEAMLMEKRLAGNFAFTFEGEDTERHFGYSEQSRRYWAEPCDIPDGLEFRKMPELLNAAIFGGKSLIERWQDIHWDTVEGMRLDDWIAVLMAKEDDEE